MAVEQNLKTFQFIKKKGKIDKGQRKMRQRK